MLCIGPIVAVQPNPSSVKTLLDGLFLEYFVNLEIACGLRHDRHMGGDFWY